MNKKEQDIMQKLKEHTDDVKVPEGLEPQRIEKMLKGKRKKRTPYYIAGLAAACVALIAGTAVYMNVQRNAKLRSDYVPQKSGNVQISEDKMIASAKDYEEVYDYLEAYKKEMEKSSSQTDGQFLVQEAKTMEDTSASAGAAAENRTEYSGTNVRQSGVDEGDVVKTDGTYLYVLKENRSEVSVVDTRGDEMQKVGRIEAEDSLWIEELYLDSDRKQLVLVCNRYEDKGAEEQVRADRFYWYAGNTEAVIYNIENPENIQETGRVTQSGNYSSSRMADGYLYLFSNYSVSWKYMDDMKREKPETYIPLVNDTVIAEKDICMPMVPGGKEYTVVTAVDMKAPDEVSDSKALLSQGGTLYVSNENIYYYETDWSYGSGLLSTDEQTTIRRISYKDGSLKAEAQGKISGYIRDSFSIDEYKGYLRVVTTEGDTNAVYVLDMELETVGDIQGLAEEERVYSARLMGDTGYFVTFKETDPLFSVDFSDPENPKITGKLKIPGFSDYLHPYGEGKLLGVGMNVDEETLITDGVKLTMFDISNPGAVKEEATYVLENVYSTDVSYDYKAALADSEKNIIGLAGYTAGGENYYIFSYDENDGFVCKMEEEINGGGSSSARGLYIGETLYVVQGNIIEAYSLNEYRKTDDLIL